MPLFINSANRQVVSFVAATIGWILGTTAMSLVEWRVWYMDNTSLFPSDLACMGMWRVCVFHHTNNISRATTCHHYSYHDNYLPLDICVVQNLLLVASILGLWGKASIIFPLWNVYIGILQMNATCNPLVTSGILNIAAGLCILIGVIWNHHSVMNEEHIAFPPSFSIPFKADTQRIGSASLVACLGGFMMLLSGLFSSLTNSPWIIKCVLKCKIPGSLTLQIQDYQEFVGSITRMLYQIFPRTQDHGK